MSKRTFFRYFPSKDDLVIGKYDLFGDRIADALDARPADEPVWESLRRVFDIALDYVQDDQQRARNDAMDRIVQSTPQLTARYLEKIQRLQTLLTGRVGARLGLADTSNDPRPAAIVGASFECMQAAGVTVFAPFPADSNYFAADQPFMLNIRVTALDELVRRLEADGIAVERRAEWETEYGRFVRVHDPEGLPLELWEEVS